MRRSISQEDWPVLCSLAILVGWGLICLASAGSREAFLASGPDDRFYYLQIAWNHARLGSVTFDGLHPTNGVQPLWHLIQAAVALFTPNKEDFAVRVSLCSFALIGVSIVQIWLLPLGEDWPKARPLALLGWTAFVLASGHVLSGMENALTVCAFLWLLRAGLAMENGCSPGKGASLGLAAGLLCLSRIDHVVFVAGYVAWLVLRGRVRGKPLLLAAGLTFAGLLAYLACMSAWGGTPMSISGAVKATGLPSTADVLFYRLEVAAKALGLGQFRLLPLVCAAAAGTALLLVRRGRGPSQLQDLAALLGLAGVHMILLVAVLFAVRFWYFSAAHLVLIILAAIAWAEVFGERRLAAVGLAAAYVGTLFAAALLAPVPVPPVNQVRIKATQWIERHLPASVVLASWNAGQISWQSGRRVINLDGLVNHRPYLEEVLSGRKLLSEYVKEQDIEYIIDYQDYTEDEWLRVCPQAAVLESDSAKFSLPVRVWRVKEWAAATPGGRLKGWK